MGYAYDDQSTPEQSKSKNTTKSKSVYIVVVENQCVRLLPRSAVTQALPTTSRLAVASPIQTLFSPQGEGGYNERGQYGTEEDH
jgi:hypothetical protein